MTRTASSWRFVQRFLALFVPCAALLGGLVFWLDASSQRTERARIEQSEGLVVALAHTALAHEFEEVVADVQLLADSAELQRVLEDPRQRPDRLITEYVALSRYRRLYEQVRLLDATGMEVVRVNFNNGQPAAVPQAELKPRGAQPYFADTFALGPGAVFVSAFERDVEQAHVARPDQPMIGVGTPVVDRQGRKRGIVILNYDGSEFFAALARASAPAIGQIMLLNRDGLRLRGPRPEMEQGGPVPDHADRTFAQAFPAVWAEIRAAETGQLTTADGLFTFSTMYPLADAQHASAGPTRPDLPVAAPGRAQAYHWKLVSRVAPAVLDTRLRQGLHQVLPIALAALAVLGGGAAVLARVGLKHTQAAEALQASERRLRDLLGTVHLLAVMLDPARRITYVNEHFCQVTGWTAADLLGQDWGATVLQPETWPAVLTMLQGALTTGGVARDTEYPIQTRDGRQRLIVWANTVLRDPTGRIVGVASFGRDITEQRAAAAALAESEARFRAAVDAFPAEFVIYDAERRLQYINDFGRRVADSLGIPDPLGKRDEEIFPPEATAGFLPHLARAYATRQPQEFEWTQPAALGARTLILHYVPLCDDTGRLRQVLGIAHDITARKHADEALRQAHDELEQRVQERTAALSAANRALADQADRLRALATELTLAEQRERRRLATVLHDEHQQLLVAAKLQATRLERTGDAGGEEACRELTALLDQVLARNRSLTQELSPPILQTGRLIPAIEWLAGWMAQTHRLQVVVQADPAVLPGAEELTVLLFQAVRELLFNVVKHAQAQTARVDIARQDDQARIEVSDAGVGFDPTAPQMAGSFGLVSLRQRLGALGGRVEIDSAPGRGTRVTLWAPVQRPRAATTPEPVQPAEPDESGRATGTAPASGASRKIRILMVDDHTIVRHSLMRVLAAEPDIEIVGEAANGQMAVELTQQLSPDVVLMDISMPVLNGIEATRLIHAAHPAVRVIGLSVFDATEQAQVMRDAGAAAYLSKAGPFETLLGTIRECVESTREGEDR